MDTISATSTGVSTWISLAQYRPGPDAGLLDSEDVTQVAVLAEPVVASYTGLGARELFGEEELVPLKGQFEVLLPQPEIDYAVGMGDFYMFPRDDEILLGGTCERGVESLEPNPDATHRIFEGHQQIFQGMEFAS